MSSFLRLRSFKTWPRKFKTGRRLSSEEQIHFVKRLSFLIKANIPISDSMEIIENQTTGKRQGLIYKEIKKNLEEGKSLAASLEKFVDNFSRSVIHAGESGGFLDKNLIYLSEQLKKKKELSRKIIGAMIYPSIIALATIGIIVFLILYVFPKITPILLSLNVELPITTRAVISVSSFIQNFWLLGFLTMIILLVSFIFIFKFSSGFQFLVHRLIFKVPLFGNLYKDFVLSNFCRTLGFLLNAGLSIDKSIQINNETIANLFLRSKFLVLTPDIEKGKPFFSSLGYCPEVFPETMVNMTMVAEKTGNLSQVLIQLADYFEEEFDNKIKKFSLMIEPTLMIVAGLLVGFVAVSIIAPVYEVTQSLQRR